MVHGRACADRQYGLRAPCPSTRRPPTFRQPDQAAQLFELKQYGTSTAHQQPDKAVLKSESRRSKAQRAVSPVASGMAAQFISMMTLLSPGDEVVASSHLYGGTVTS